MGVRSRCGWAGGFDRGGDGMSKRIIRVFPRRTKATPVDELAIVGREPGLFDEADEVHISVAFTCDIPEWARPAIIHSAMGRNNYGQLPRKGTDE